MNENLYTVSDAFINKVAKIISFNEGNYGSVNRDDHRALSIGILQWHGVRAKKILERIVNKNVIQAKEILHETNLFDDISKDNNFWRTRTANPFEAYKLSRLLTTKEGIDAQDELSMIDIKAYIQHGIRLGIRDQKLLAYLADIENQLGPYAVEKIIQCLGGGSETTLQKVANVSMQNPDWKIYKKRRVGTFIYIMNTIF